MLYLVFGLLVCLFEWDKWYGVYDVWFDYFWDYGGFVKCV